MAGRPRRKARLIAQGKRLPSWGRSASVRSESGRGAKVKLAHHEVRTTSHRASAPNHEIIEGHPSQAPKASPGTGAPFCSSSSIKKSDIAYHVGSAIAAKHMKRLPAAFRRGQVVVTTHDDDDGVGSVYTVVASWCDGGRLKTFVGEEGS